MNETNARYQKTEQKILDTFYVLLKERGFDAINVKQILDRAEISKSTFYVHYQDKYELLDAFENQIIDRFLHSEDEISSKWLRDNPSLSPSQFPHVDALIHTLYEDAEKYAVLMSDKGDSIVFTEKIRKAIHEIWNRLDLHAHSGIPTNYILAGTENLAFGLVREWVANGCRESEEEFKAIYTRILSAMTPLVLGKD